MSRRKPSVVHVCAPDREAQAEALKALMDRSPRSGGVDALVARRLLANPRRPKD